MPNDSSYKANSFDLIALNKTYLALYRFLMLPSEPTPLVAGSCVPHIVLCVYYQALPYVVVTFQ